MCARLWKFNAFRLVGADHIDANMFEEYIQPVLDCVICRAYMFKGKGQHDCFGSAHNAKVILYLVRSTCSKHSILQFPTKKSKLIYVR